LEQRTAALKPLTEALAADIVASATLHADDTPVPVLMPGAGRTKTGRLWVYVRDERPFAGSRPPAAVFVYSPDRKGEHPRRHLEGFAGALHADGYAGFNGLFESGRIRRSPATTALKDWAEDIVSKLSGKSELAAAFRYMRGRWPSLIRCFDDGRLALDNNAAERALRGVAMARSLCSPLSSICKH
jgi:hypothetical protein